MVFKLLNRKKLLDRTPFAIAEDQGVFYRGQYPTRPGSDFFEGPDGLRYQDQGECDARNDALIGLYGEPSMRALVIPRHEATTRESIQQFFGWMDVQTPRRGKESMTSARG